MAASETARVGKRGTLVVPAMLRRRFEFTEDALIIAEERPDGMLLRSAVAIATDAYTPELKAAFLLENAVDAADYARVRESVRSMGLDPAKIPHGKPHRARKKPKDRKSPTR
jgi:bifunctional DNA-binding transcriptional regulator/antitoxin component of YhaV-PrlF toxin-antitoxin module